VVSPTPAKPTTTLGGATTIKASTFMTKRTVSVVATPSTPALLEGELLSGAGVGKIGQSLLGRARLGLGAGRRTLNIRVSQAIAKTIVRRARSRAFRRAGYPVTVRVLTTDAIGLSNTTSRTVRIKR
jgi:hypothetical protein